MKETLEDKAFHLVLGFFNEDTEKACLWFTAKNPLLGNITPNEMINSGRTDKLLRFKGS